MRIDNDYSSYSVVAMVVGCISMFLWLIPIVSVFSALFTLYLSYRGIESEKKDFSYIGICLGLISLVFTVMRSAFVNGSI